METKDLVFGFICQTYWTNIDAFLSLLSSVGIFIAIIILIHKNITHSWKRWRLKKYILVCGLDENNRVYIDSEINDNNLDIIIIEENKDNLYIKEYRKKGLLVEIGNPTDKAFLSSILKIGKVKHILVSAGDDLINLEIVTHLLAFNPMVKLYVNIIDRQLRHFHKEKGIFKKSSIKIYSYYEEASRDLFNKFSIEGNNNTIINSYKSYSIVVIGNTPLAYEVISQACIVGQLPNENILKIYCIDKNIKEFENSINLNYTQIDSIKTVKLEYHSLDINSKEFYESKIWDDNITNIIVCLDDEKKNLSIASNLAEITYINEIAKDELKTNILSAAFNDYSFTQNIKLNDKAFKNFYTFGSIHEINHKNMIINEERDIQAKCVNYIYNNIEPILVDYEMYTYKYTTINIEEPINIEDDWKKLGYFKQESNRAVADHFKTKLKFLGLKVVKHQKNEDFITLYNENINIFKKVLSKEVKLKLARNEHQRWNTFHYLNGFKKIDIVSKNKKKELREFHELKKEHMCLIPFEMFKLRKNEFLEKGYSLGSFEGYDFMMNEHIPLIMAKSGYKIISIRD